MLGSIMNSQFAQMAKNIGVSRLADVTGLDRVGLPVVAAIRPLSRNITVSFGKGKTYEIACLSALMEAAELYFSETCQLPIAKAKYLQLGSEVALNPMRLELVGQPEDALVTDFQWVTGFCLKSKKPIMVPWEIISMDYSMAARKNDRVLAFGPTGLAAAFDESRAILHGLYEVIERDCHNAWNTASDENRENTLVDLNCIHATESLELLGQLKSADLQVLLWDMTGSNKIPCYLAEVFDLALCAPTAYTQGAAADISPQQSIYRALSEAVQIRLTYISGSRDDLERSDYGHRYDEIIYNRKWILENLKTRRQIPKAPKATSQPSSDLEEVCRMLDASGIDDVIVVRLTREHEDVKVVKVIVPSLKDVRVADEPTLNRNQFEFMSA